MATADPNFSTFNLKREPTEIQLAQWDDDGGNQYLYSEIVFINGKIVSGSAAHLYHIITKYWEQLSQSVQMKELELTR